MIHSILNEYHLYSKPVDELWYHEVHEWAGALGDIVTVAGITAALSPNLSWDRNIELAEQALKNGKACGALPLSCSRANQILDGANPLDVLGGNKTRNFFMNIVAPYDYASVTIDRHSFAVALNRKVTDAEQRKLSSANLYAKVLSAYQDAADEVGIIPSELQAATWCSWRERYKGKTVGVQ